MMRSLFSGVAGLRVHQTRMDVIGNNIANVNTTSYKSQSMVFSDLLYQTTQSASAANAATGRGGINARQIGLGAKTGAISTAITTQGSAQSTNNPFDVMITGDSFFIVSNGSENFFTRDGSFTVDGAGNLVMSSTGYTVMGWQTDPETGDILPDVVSALKIMSAENLVYPPESTTRAYASGTVDKNDTALASTAGKVFTLNFFDKRGYNYTAKFSIHKTDTEDSYNVRLDDILDSTAESIVEKYNLGDISEVAVFGATSNPSTERIYSALTGVTCDTTANPPTYKQDLSAASILEGFDTNAMIKLAESWQITTTGDVAEGGDVTVTGTVKLDKDTLEGEPFNLMFVSDGTTHKYIKGTGTDADLNSTDKWTAALAELNVSGIAAVPTVDADGNVTLNFTQTFKSTRAATVKDTQTFTAGITQLEAFGLMDEGDTTYVVDYTSPDGLRAQITKTVRTTGNALVFDTETGEFMYVGSPEHDSVTMSFRNTATSRDGQVIDLSFFTDMDIDFSLTNSYNNGGVSTASAVSGDKGGNNIGAGRKRGEMNGIEIAQDGKITAYYDNSQSKLLGQIAVANFANASGLAKQGDNLYSATSNSGEFDGIGDDITASGDGYMTSGVLEMSNVDLSSEFTEMITTQRGFQANSRIITVSDTLLEELVNLKR